MNKTEENVNPILSKSTLWLMTIGSGLVVANIYYNQPLLGKIAREFNISESKANNIAMVTQIGYALGLFFLIPLGDMFKRRPVIIADFVIIILSLLAFAISQTIEVMIVTSFFIGFCSVVPQMFVPIVAQLSKPNEKGKNVGIVMTGLLIGILCSRVISGFVGEYWGWREMYYLAAVIIFILGILIYYLLPEIKPTFSGTYGQLMSSLVYYFKTVPILRLTALRGALAFGSFLAFWTSLTFHLEEAPFFAGSNIAGAFGLVGIGGALVASIVGRLSDKVSKNKLILLGLVIMLISWGCFGVWGFTYAGLIVGIFLLDVGLQSVQVTSQTIIYSLNPVATNRFNTIYMTSYFIGGSLGTFVGGKAWSYGGWMGVVAVGAGLIIATLIIHCVYMVRTKHKM